jgi:hypothetical protein
MKTELLNQRGLEEIAQSIREPDFLLDWPLIRIAKAFQG